jgi:D-methionine transport system substrate-binding protein
MSLTANSSLSTLPAAIGLLVQRHPISEGFNMVKQLLAASWLSLLVLSGAQAETIKVGVTAGPFAEILDVAKGNAARDGLIIEPVEFSDFVGPNAALASGDLHANSYQHRPFLQAQIDARGYDLVPVGKTVLVPIAFYSKRFKSVDEIPAGATIAIPNDPSNEARTLLLLETTGLIKLRPNAGFKATPFDIVENPKNLKFIELEAAQLARSLDDVHAAAVNTNYALQAGLNPLESLVREGPQSRYICEVVVRRQDIDKPWVKQLVAAFQSPNIQEFIDTRFKGAVIAGW